MSGGFFRSDKCSFADRKKRKATMADGSRIDTIEVVVEEAMQQKLQFNLLRKRVLLWVKERGGSCLSVDRHNGAIVVDMYTEEGERIQVPVPESSAYQTYVRLSTW
jgi:hypothetical protein